MTLSELKELATNLHSRLTESPDFDELVQKATQVEVDAEEAAGGATEARDAADEAAGYAEEAVRFAGEAESYSRDAERHADEAGDKASEAAENAAGLRRDLDTLREGVYAAIDLADEISTALANLSAGLTEEQEDAIRLADERLHNMLAAFGQDNGWVRLAMKHHSGPGNLRRAFPELFKDEPAETQEEEGGTPFIEYDNSVPMDHPAETQEEVTA